MLKASMKIMVIDDVDNMRKIIKGHLQQMGFKNVIESPAGEPAWQTIKEAAANNQPVEFVISDCEMPGMSGIDLLKEIRANESTKKLPFLLVSEGADQKTIVTAVQAGVNNFIVKPFSVATLKEKIDKIFNK